MLTHHALTLDSTEDAAVGVLAMRGSNRGPL